MLSTAYKISRLKEEILSQKSMISRSEDDKRELSNLLEALRGTNEKCGKLNSKLEEEILDKVGHVMSLLDPFFFSFSTFSGHFFLDLISYQKDKNFKISKFL